MELKIQFLCMGNTRVSLYVKGKKPEERKKGGSE